MGNYANNAMKESSMLADANVNDSFIVQVRLNTLTRNDLRQMSTSLAASFAA